MCRNIVSQEFLTDLLCLESNIACLSIQNTELRNDFGILIESSLISTNLTFQLAALTNLGLVPDH